MKQNRTTRTDEVLLRHDEKREKLFMRPGVIDEEPDSIDSIISNPSSFPITVVPPTSSGGAGILIRNSTQSSFGRISRISTNSRYVFDVYQTNVITKCDIIRIFSKLTIIQVKYCSSVWWCDYVCVMVWF